MNIIQETYAWNRGNFKPNAPNTIVIHHAAAASCTVQQIHQWHLERGWQGFAYHYFIKKNGEIHTGRKENQQGGHLLGSENINTLGICLEGNYDSEKTVPDTQLKALVELCHDIEARWKIKAYKKHADYSSAQKIKKDCPGKYFPWSQFTAMLVDPVAEYKKIIQAKCGFNNPDGVWKAIDTHPYPKDVYRMIAESYSK
jgi:N-acetyl-anhydromuramyl-L-alanine amidase AmpD